MPKRKVSKPVDPAKAIVKAIAMDIGKHVVAHHQQMKPDAFKGNSLALSIRNMIYVEIMAAIEITDEKEILKRLQERRVHRRKMNAIYNKIRKPK